VLNHHRNVLFFVQNIFCFNLGVKYDLTGLIFIHLFETITVRSPNFIPDRGHLFLRLVRSRFRLILSIIVVCVCF